VEPRDDGEEARVLPWRGVLPALRYWFGDTRGSLGSPLMPGGRSFITYSTHASKVTVLHIGCTPGASVCREMHMVTQGAANRVRLRQCVGLDHPGLRRVATHHTTLSCNPRQMQSAGEKSLGGGTSPGAVCPE
jgi:hypothetical protein